MRDHFLHPQRNGHSANTMFMVKKLQSLMMAPSDYLGIRFPSSRGRRVFVCEDSWRKSYDRSWICSLSMYTNREDFITIIVGDLISIWLYLRFSCLLERSWTHEFFAYGAFVRTLHKFMSIVCLKKRAFLELINILN